MTWRGLCSVTACLGFSPSSQLAEAWQVSEIARIAQVLPKEKKKSRLAGIYFRLYLPVYSCFELCILLEYEVGQSKKPSRPALSPRSTDCAAQGSETGLVYVPWSILPEPEV